MASPSFAQTTLVTGQVTDPNGIRYAFASVSAGMVNANGQTFSTPATVTLASNSVCQAAGLGPAPCQAPFPTSLGPYTLDASGNIPLGGITLEDNSMVTPAGTLWRTCVTTGGIPPPGGTGPQTFCVNVSVTGASQAIGATLSAAAPALGAGPLAGTVTTLNNIKFPINCAGTDLGAQINACSTLAGAGGTLWVTASGTIATPLSLQQQTHLLFEPGTYTIPATQTISGDGITFDCANPASTHLVPSGTTDLFVITGAFFRMARCAIEPSSTSSRAGSALFNIQGSQGELRDLRYVGNATSPNNGWVVLDTGAAGAGGTWKFSGGIRSQGTWNGGYQFKASAATIAGITISDDVCFTGATNTVADMVFDTLVDTAIVQRAQNGCAGPGIIVQNSGAAQAPRWVDIASSSIECGGTGANVGLTVTDGREISYHDGYIATCQNAVSVSGGVGVSVTNNKRGIINIGQHSFLLSGTATNVTFSGNNLEDCGVTTTNTYDCFNVAGGMQDFHIDFNHFRQPNANKARFGINNLAGASNFFTEIGNDPGNAAFGTAFLNNLATGATQHIHSNVASISHTLNNTPITTSLTATSASLGGSLLAAGACSTTTTTVTGATTAMVAIADPNTYPGDGAYWAATVTSANTVTTKVCAVVSLTPAASTYTIKVFTQ